MKQIYTLILLSCSLFLSIAINAQDRYLDDVFTGVSVQKGVTYGTNISILTGAPIAIELKMDIYTPEGDDRTDRPIMLIAHSGNFLPQYFNGGITGGLLDSAVVNIARRLAKKGYVAAIFTYRQGWLPLAEGLDTRKGTYLHAWYRAVQDARTAVRYIRKSIIEDENPYGVDPDKIGMWGVGTGANVVFGAASWDEYEELSLDKFLHSETLLTLIDTILLGNFYATTEATLSLPNHLGYSSDFSLCVNMSGSIGDLSWLEGKDNEPAFIGYHSTGDYFAPFDKAPYIFGLVPASLEMVILLNLLGTYPIISKANEIGNNDVFRALDPSFDPLASRVEIYKKTKILTYPVMDSITLGVDHMYPFLLPPPQGSPWDWWDKPTLDFVIDSFVNPGFGTNFDPDVLHNNGLIINPGMSPEKGNAYLDTIFIHAMPRACLALNLGCSVSGLEELSPMTVGMKVYPNPVQTETTIEVNPDERIKKVYLYDVSGRLVQARTQINSYTYQLNRNGLTSGVYFAKVHMEMGVITKQILFE